MPQKTVAPYGSWKSPITSDLIVSKMINLGSASAVGEDIYWRSCARRRAADR